MNKEKEKQEGDKRLYLLDASSYAFRAYHATLRQGLSNSKGIPTGATMTFVNMLMKLIREENPTHIAVIWDAPGKTFRHEKFPQYKAQRAEMPSELGIQIGHMRQIVDALNLPSRELEGYEADDVIGAVSEKARSRGYEVVIVTGDKDLTQLVGPHVRLLDTMKDHWTDESKVKEKYGVGPDKVPDVLGLMGDSSDNIPGVPKIGEKTAIKLMSEYGDMESVLKNADSVKGKVGENLKTYADQARLSKELVTIVSDLPLEFDLDNFIAGEPDHETLMQILAELELKRLMKELTRVEKQISYKKYRLLTDPAELKRFADQAREKGHLCIDTETSSVSSMNADLVGTSMALEEGEAVYVPLFHNGPGSEKQMEWEQARDILAPLLADESIKKIGQNLKYDLVVLSRAGMPLGGVYFDTMVASYLADPRRRSHGLDELAWDYLDHKMIKYEDLCGKGKNQKPFSSVPLEDALEYAGEDADIALMLYRVLADRLEQLSLRKLFDEIEMPLIPVLARMETAGVKIEPERLAELSGRFQSSIDELKKKIYELAGEEFNIDSPKQLAEVLFVKKKLARGKKTKTGYSTSVEVLSSLAEEHELPGKVLEYRSLAKLKNTYTDALPKLINQDTGRIHTSFNQTVTSTGRLSSSDPNLQNIPIRAGEGKIIRQAFVGEDGNYIVAADYSQIELRLMAHLSEEPALIESFEKGEDIHSRTAAEVFGVSPELVTGDMRRQAKVINFGILYGMSAHGLTKQLDVDHDDAKKYIEAYFARYPYVKKYIEDTVALAKEKGYVSTIKGRRLPTPDVCSTNYIARQAAEREAVNAPLQGSAADIIKSAMIAIDRELIKDNYQSRMIMQVHDELVFEAAPAELSALKQMVKLKMESAETLRVKLEVEISEAENWAEAH
ncbi:MAG: DNA polymerase I [bacterium]